MSQSPLKVPCRAHPDCPDCDEELRYLDSITRRSTGRTLWILYVCRNEDCDGYGLVYNERNGELRRGDPSGNY